MENKELDLLNENPLNYYNLYYKFENTDKNYHDMSELDEIIFNIRKNFNIDDFYIKNECRNYFKEEDLQIYDNLIHEEIIININKNFLSKCLWRRQISGQDSNSIKFFMCNIIDNKYFNNLFYECIVPYINLKNKDKLKIFRNYVNLNLPGTPGFWHVDGPANGPTILVYLNDNWNTSWGGQTAFYTDRKNLIIKYVDVKPGRVIVFKPNIEHMACDLSVYALKDNVNRYTLAYHTYFEK